MWFGPGVEIGMVQFGTPLVYHGIPWYGMVSVQHIHSRGIPWYTKLVQFGTDK